MKTYMSVLPGKSTLAWQHFNEFEKRLAQHRDRFFKTEAFPFAGFSNVTLSLAGPFIRTPEQAPDAAFAPEYTVNGPTKNAPGSGNAPMKTSAAIANAPTKTIPLTGGVQMMDELIAYYHLPDSTAETFYITTELYSESAKEIHAWIGFETVARSTRLSAGIPAAGKWDANGGEVWVNGEPLPAPKWLQPGAYRYLTHTWERPGNEIPFTDEEFFWSRPPVAIALRKGWNQVMIRVPRSYKEQNWQCAFVPVKPGANGRWVEDTSLRFR